MLDTNNLFQLDEFRGKPILSITDGQRIGRVEDILIDPGNMKIEGIVISRGGFLRSDLRAIRAGEVQVWGQDAVLVHHPDVVRRKDEFSELENCLSANDHIGGRDVITLDGDRIGELKDLLINAHGDLAGYEVTKTRNEFANLFDGKRRRDYSLPISTIHSFGKDVLIIDVHAVEGLEHELNRDYQSETKEHNQEAQPPDDVKEERRIEDEKTYR